MVLLAGCTLVDPTRAAHENLQRLAAAAGFVRHDLPGGKFPLAVLTRGTPAAGQPLIVFLEGDGQPWISRWQPARDPSPLDPLAFRLAAATPGPVAYLPRPCQFVSSADAAQACHVELWTSQRYGEEIVAAMDHALDSLTAGSDGLILIGYSGGGTIAALVAARRHDIRRLITVAAPLDITAWCRGHGLPPLSGSLSPRDELHRLVGTEQIHFVGSDDTVVSPAANLRFFEHLHPSAIRLIPEFDHDCCWVNAWPELFRSIGSR